MRMAPPTMTIDRRHRVLADAAEVEVERPGHREEEVEVDERPGDREEDLLDEVGREGTADGRGRDDRHEHHQRDECPDVRREEAVHRDPHGVRGHDRGEPNLAGVGGAEDAVVREAGEGGLTGLECDARDDRVDREILDLVPEVGEPPDDVDAGDVEEGDHDDDGDERRADLEHPLPPPLGGGLQGGVDCRLAHRRPDPGALRLVTMRHANRSRGRTSELRCPRTGTRAGTIVAWFNPDDTRVRTETRVSKAQPMARKRPREGRGHPATRLAVTVDTTGVGLFLGP